MSTAITIIQLGWQWFTWFGFPSAASPVLIGNVKTQLIQIFQELAIEKEWAIRALEVAPNHIHLFVEIHPTDAINQVVKAFKGRSAYLLRSEFPELKKRAVSVDKQLFFHDRW